MDTWVILVIMNDLGRPESFMAASFFQLRYKGWMSQMHNKKANFSISTDYYISWVWDATGCFWTTSNQIYNFALGRHKSILKDFQIFSGDFNGWPGVPIHK